MEGKSKSQMIDVSKRKKKFSKESESKAQLWFWIPFFPLCPSLKTKERTTRTKKECMGELTSEVTMFVKSSCVEMSIFICKTRVNQQNEDGSHDNQAGFRGGKTTHVERCCCISCSGRDSRGGEENVLHSCLEDSMLQKESK
jgi:hypothetical protein